LTIHTVIMYCVIIRRKETMEQALKQLLTIERKLLDGSLIAMEILEQFGEHIQTLHEMSRALIILEHYNERSMSTIGNLLKDLDRLRQRSLASGHETALRAEAIERVRDGLSCLQDFCSDQSRRLRNRKQRVQNLITLVRNRSDDGHSFRGKS
jgi:hypothetical protein